ncbi:MFS transporter [Nocardioides sp. YIM 152315]|nr:MFS transporter [Nocardioides sp. YIM 152315]
MAIALLGLVPNVTLQTSTFALGGLVSADLGASATAVQVVGGLGSAAYAVGAVTAAQLAQRYGQRRLFLGYGLVFVAASVVTASAPGIALFSVGRVVEGLAAGAMLISALPPLVARFPASRLPLTAVVVNVGIFGASTLGPIVGGYAAAAGSWRALFVASAALGALGWIVALVGYADIDPADPEGTVDRAALALTVVATVATFVGTALLTGAAASSPTVWIPIAVGLAALVALLWWEDRHEGSLIPVRALSTQLPVTGIVVASIGGAVFVAAVDLLQQVLADGGAAPEEIAALCWPMPVGVVVGAVAFGVVPGPLRRRR